MQQAEEQAIIERAVRGDAAAFSALLEAYYMMIYRSAYRWVGNRADAEDITQEVCIRAAGAIRQFRSESKFSTWLYRIMLSAISDMKRRARPHQPLEDAEAMGVDPGGANPHEEAERAALWSAVRRLPQVQCNAVLLVYAQGCTHAEAAEVMGCAESTVSWHVHEARKQLKAEMTDDR